jgi:hypothetical protein
MAYMTDRGPYILVEADELSFEELLEAVRTRGKLIRICRGGEPIADIQLPGHVRLPPADPRLKVKFAPGVDPAAPLDDEDWPEQLR